MNRERVRRAGTLSAIASFALVVLVACGQGDNTLVLEDVTRVPVMSDAAAQATKEAAAAGTPSTGEQVAATGEQAAPAAASPAAEGAAPAAEAVTVTSHDIYFEPKELTIPANTDVTVHLPNEGVTAHNFSIDALGISVDQAPGETDKTVVINAPPGDYEYYCNVPGHKEAGMVGTLHVVAGAAAPAAAASPAVAAPVAPAAGTAAPAAAPAPETVTVVSHDIYFDPKEFTIPANTDVTVKLPNEGVTLHDFSIDALGISVAIQPGATESVVINAPPGDYEYYCNVPGHKEAGMVGTLHVVEGAAAPAAEGAAPAGASPAAEAPAAAPAAPAASPAAEAAQEAPAAPATSESVAVVSHDIYFDPKEVTIPANTDVIFELPNEGVTAHDFSIDALGISVGLPPGTTEHVVINAPPGDYEFYCNVPGHKEAGMVGTLHVVEGAAPPAAAGGAAPAAATAAQESAAPAEASPAATPATGAAAPAASAETVTVVSHDIYFDPKEFTIPANTDVTVELPNEGVTLHDFSIDALGISVAIQPGATEQVVINAPPGTYEYYCNVPGHKEAGMVGTMIVK